MVSRVSALVLLLCLIGAAGGWAAGGRRGPQGPGARRHEPGPRVASANVEAECTPPVPVPRQLLANASLDTMTDGRAAGWIDNQWNGATLRYAIAPGYTAGNAQRLIVERLPAGGGVLFAQRINFEPGVTYEGRIRLRSPDAATVHFYFRRQGHDYEAMAVQRVTLTPAWQEFVIRGGWRDWVPAYVGINFVTAGTVDVDDASLLELAATDCIANRAPLEPIFMGMTVNKWGTYNTWPGAQGFRLLRMWDTATRWKDLEPNRDNWDWFRMDYYVQAARAHGQEIIYTLGMTPQWATARRGDFDRAEPASIGDWRNYVRTVARRYKGRIKYWEIWNEVNYPGFYTGSVEAMLELTRAAREELHAVDPGNVVLSPNISKYGFTWLDEFLAKGGGAYVDIISWHLYADARPERAEPEAAGLRDIVARHGLAHLPIWNTEGNIEAVLNDPDEAMGAVARAHLVQPWWGNSSFTVYAWDIDFGTPLSQPGYLAPTDAGIAYREVGKWLTGAAMRGRARSDEGTWQVTLERRDGSIAYVVWNEERQAFTLPESWAVVTQRDLRGGSQPLLSRTIDVGPAPLLLVP